MRSFFGWSVAIAVAILVSAGGVAQAKSSGIKILGAGQSTLIRKGVKVSVSGKPGSKVKVSVKSRSFDEGLRKFAKPKTVRLGKRGQVKVVLKLTPSAKKAAASCSARTLIADGVGSGRTRGRSLATTADSGNTRQRAKSSMVRDRPDCRLLPVDLSRKDDCDFIAQPKEGMCMMPFPNDYYTRSETKDPSRGQSTGRRIHFTTGGMPQNSSRVPISPDLYNDSDGFSQGQGIMLKVPGLDTRKRWPKTISSASKSWAATRRGTSGQW